MIAWVVCAVLATDWVEIGTGVPFEDDITSVRMLEGPNDLWIGTRLGFVYRSTDGGETLRQVFGPLEQDPWVVPRLTQLRAASVGDLARGLGSDLPARDREGYAQQQVDIAGNVAARPRDRGTRILSSFVRSERRYPGEINVVTRCHDHVFIATANGLWRSRASEVRFEQRHLVPASRGADWVSCDWTRPGRLVVITKTGIFESVDFGDTFFPYSNAFPMIGGLPVAASFDDGALVVLIGRTVFRETEDRRGWLRTCTVTGDSAESDQPEWTWETGDGSVFAVTRDGILVCRDDVTVRLSDDNLARKPVRGIYVMGEKNQYIAVATADDVFESRDGGKSFTTVYSRRTVRSIGGIGVHEDAPDALIVASGSQIFRRAAQPSFATERPEHVERLFALAPLWEVVQVALDRLELQPSQVAARRDDSNLAGIMPFLSLSMTHIENRASFALLQRPGARDVSGRLADELTVWRGLVVFDLADLVSSPSQTDRAWVDVERLRREVTYRIEDAYVSWVRAAVALERGNLSAAQRAYHTLTRREMAAYLNHMTGEAFAAFYP